MPKAVRDEMHLVSDDEYKERLQELQIELVKLQRHNIANDLKLLVIVEGRDAAGKDGVIKRVVEHLSPRETRVVALGKPTEREKSVWYFQRWVPHLPAAEEFVLFNRSWYNRAGVERVMGFCTDDELEEFCDTVGFFEQMLIRSGVVLIKYYMDISKAEQKHRMKERRRDPLKQWKISPIDAVANKLWTEYSEARNDMLARTHTPASPWNIVKADHKKTARINLISDLLARFDYEGKKPKVIRPNPSVVFSYDPAYVESGLIAP
ncbi:polyphosphate kinase 2 [Emcibacter sp. SYSU 3D8]|uniref:polyphosphate kinase 2 n=1 Tax=Emcibacter sp. SYSU 3D8 TaxID=3133969 RepID=UPI0031FF463D